MCPVPGWTAGLRKKSITGKVKGQQGAALRTPSRKARQRPRPRLHRRRPSERRTHLLPRRPPDSPRRFAGAAEVFSCSPQVRPVRHHEEKLRLRPDAPARRRLRQTGPRPHGQPDRDGRRQGFRTDFHHRLRQSPPSHHRRLHHR